MKWRSDKRLRGATVNRRGPA